MIMRFLIVLSMSVSAVMAAGSSMEYLDARIDVHNTSSLQRGAVTYMNYCSGCHSLKYMRYNRMAEDLKIDEEALVKNLLITADKPGERIEIGMSSEDGKKWFGVNPPDLSVIARSRSTDWLYSYLVTFYLDENPSRPFGVNNVVFKDVGMPHVMWPLQGYQSYVKEDVEGTIVSEHINSLETAGDLILIRKSVKVADDANGGFKELDVTDRLEVAQAGVMAPGEFRLLAKDLSNFLHYVAEPAQLHRSRIGLWVVLFLTVLFAMSVLLYKEYWRDIH